MIRAFRLALILVVVACAAALGQTKTSLSGDALLFEEMKSGLQGNLKQDALPVGNIVDPEVYFIGPGDVLSIQNLFVSAQGGQSVVVSPENTVQIPRIGEINLSGLTLAQARKIIIDRISGTNSEATVFVGLALPRTVIVTLTGNSSFSGTYSFPASCRISTVLKLIEKEKDANRKNYPSAGPRSNGDITYAGSGYANHYNNTTGVPTPYYRRNISIKKMNGSIVRADLLRAQYSGDSKSDPFICEGDEIFIAPTPVDFPKVSVSGAVISSTVLPFKRGDKAELLLKSGNGLTELADKDNIYLVRMDNSKIKLTANDDGSIVGTNPDLENGDVIIVGQIPNTSSSQNGVVSVSGCVKYPCSVVIEKGKTRLKQVIEQAGGFTPEASLDLAYIVRSRAEAKNGNVPMQNYIYSTSKWIDTTRFVYDETYRSNQVSCDFSKAFSNNSELDNVILEDGDFIVVPKTPNGIYIYGQVNSPGFVSYEKGKNMNWYIEKAGGFAANAKKSKARIIRGRTRVWVEGDDDIEVVPGDDIYVPRPVEDAPGMEWQSWSAIAGLIMSAATLVNMYMYWRKL